MTKLAPASAGVGGGATVTISGHFLTGVKQVLFGSAKATHVKVRSATKVVVRAPAHAAGTVSVQVVAQGGSSHAVRAARFTYVAPPQITFLDVVAGPTTGGTAVTVTGAGFTDPVSVTVGGLPATGVVVVSPVKLALRTPAHAAGVVDVVVTTSAGSSPVTGAARFTYAVPRPTVTAVSPRAGPVVGGTVVTVTGTDLTGATGVRFGAVDASTFLVLSPTTLRVTAPAHALGAVDLHVTTAGGSSSLTEGYSYVAVPTLDVVDPGSGPAAGTTVTVTGSGFTATTAVTFGGVAATDVQVQPGGTELTARTPAHAPGFVDVAATTVGGTATLVHGYLYVGGIALTGVSPALGPSAGGSTVTLSGSGFTADTFVVFGNKPSLSTTVNGPGTQITAVLPSHVAGVVDVEVANLGDSSTLAGGFTYLDAPTLTGVTPAVGPSTGGTSVALTGAGFRAGMTVTFGGTAATGVTVQSATQATVTAPAHVAGAVDVVVATPGGSATVTNGYTYVVAPTLASVAPSAGPLAAGTSVALTGTGFRAGMTVTFGGTAATGVTVQSPTQATVTAPAHVAGAVDVVVTTPGGSATATNGYTYVVAPTLVSVSPSAGPLAAGTAVTLTGSSFRAGMTVTFGGTAATGLTVQSVTQATVTAPAHAAGAVDVVATTPGGSATAANGYSYVVAPTLVSVSPSAGPLAGGTSVTLTGAGFRAGMSVTFGGQPATAVSVSPGGAQLTALTPAHAAGTVDVSVATPGGTDTLSNAYTYLGAPTLTSLAPAAGPVTGGTTVTLTGTGFRPAMTVLFGSTPLAVVVSPDGTQASVSTPTHAAGAVDVSVTTSGGSASLLNGFTYVAAPTLTGVSPAAGPVAGGGSVVLTGSGFRAGMLVQLGGGPAPVTAVAPGGGQATVTAPPHSAGTVDVTVTTPGGSTTLGNGYAYTALPTASGVSPGTGLVAGGTSVTLTGANLSGTTSLTFGGVAATNVVVVNASTVTATTPAHAAGAVDVVVTTPGGSSTLANGFTYAPAPSLSSVNPGVGPVVGGTSVTLSGTGLTGTTSVTFGGVPATNVVVVNGSTVTATTPAHVAGAVDVVVTTSVGSSTLTNGFTYAAAPTVSAVTPASGPTAGGQSVTLTGTGFRPDMQVTFDGLPVTNLVVVGPTEATMDTPAHAAGAVDVAVSTPGGASTVPGAFTYLAPPPSLTGLSPVSGPDTGGTSVTLTGDHLTGTTDVTFDGVPATDVVVVDDQTVTVTTPAHVDGAVDVRLTTPFASSSLTGAFTYTP